MKANSPEEALEQIIKNYSVQLENYRMTLTLSQEQLVAAQAKNTTLVDQILDRRQLLITDIDQLNTGLKDLKASVLQTLNIKDFNLTELSKVLPVPAGELQKVIVQIGEILVQTAESDKLNQQTLAQDLQGISREIKKTKTFRDVRSAYSDLGAKDKEAKYIDKSK